MMGKKADGYWIRTGDWFFNLNNTDNTKNLFDMRTDPENNVNLAPSNPKMVKEFTQKIENWKKEVTK